MTLRFVSLSSGSSGNCQYIESENLRLLIDGGFSGKRIEELLRKIKVDPKSLDGIFITHEHIDHIKGVGVLSRRYDLPLYANEKTWLAMEACIGKIREKNKRVFKNEDYLNLKDMDIYPLPIYHDAQDPVAFVINSWGKKISILTDTGKIDRRILNKIRGSDLYLIESNHDIDMLKRGSYPLHLKRRILGDRGHLSNAYAGRLISELFEDKGEVVLLGHLSRDNNLPSLALETVGKALKKKEIKIRDTINLQLTYRDRPSGIFQI